MSDNGLDIFLLKNNPKKLVVKYKSVIEKMVVKTLVVTGYFQYQDKDDKVQEVITGLLQDIDKIWKSYNGYSKFSSFFIKIIMNRCIELKRKGYRQETMETVDNNPDNPAVEKRVRYFKKHEYTQLSDGYQQTDGNDTDKETTIVSELEYFDVVLRMYVKRKPEVVICLKTLSGYPVSYDDLKLYNNSCEPFIYDNVVNFSKNAKNKTKEDAYKVLSDFFNSCDKTDRKPDAVRKRINIILEDFIEQMNFVSIPPVYNKRNIIGLIGFYFDKKG